MIIIVKACLLIQYVGVKCVCQVYIEDACDKIQYGINCLMLDVRKSLRIGESFATLVMGNFAFRRMYCNNAITKPLMALGTSITHDKK